MQLIVTCSVSLNLFFTMRNVFLVVISHNSFIFTGLLPSLDNELATKAELVELKGLTFRQAVIPVDTMTSSENKDGQTDNNNMNIDESSEISVNMPTSGGIRRISKNSQANNAHFRKAGSMSLEGRAARRLVRYHNKGDNPSKTKDGKQQLNVQFNMDEVIDSIRPSIGVGDASFMRESGVLMGRSFCSYRSEGIDGNMATSIHEMMAAFPFNLPSALLAEADENVWKPSLRPDKIVPSKNLVWEATLEDNQAIGLDDSSSLSDDNKRQSEEGDGNAISSDQADGETTSKSMFGGIWEQSYRDNVTRNNDDALEPIDYSGEPPPDVTDLTSAEQTSLYDGPSDYGSLFVSRDLDLYFDSFVFHCASSDDDLQTNSAERIMAPRIQLFKFDRDLLMNSKRQPGALLPSPADLRERYIGVWKENVLACGSYARSRLPPIKLAKRGFHGDIITHAGNDVLISESRKFIICLSDSAVYFIVNDDISTQKPTSTGGKRTFPSRIPPNSVSKVFI